jgi:uncharacterized protein (TIGR02118 family)
MFKRMSVLVRRPDHDRATFSALWERHAAPVSQLPRVRGYIQNHIEEDFCAASTLRADGFVELLWDRPEDMTAAFASEAAKPMVADEPGFLGHGSGYALAEAHPLADAPGGKLIVTVRGQRGADWRGVETVAAALRGFNSLLRDEVTALIAKPGMAPPQPVDAFYHLWFNDVPAAREAGPRLAGISDDDIVVDVYRVRTIRFV